MFNKFFVYLSDVKPVCGWLGWLFPVQFTLLSIYFYFPIDIAVVVTGRKRAGALGSAKYALIRNPMSDCAL